MRLIANIVLLSSLVGLASCGFPGNQLTSSERQADMDWAFTVFEHNYAPADLKKSTFGVELSAVKADCLTLANDDMTNDAFMGLYQKCMHTVRDAHVSVAQMNNGILPEFANVAHLGFLTLRTRKDYNGQMTEMLRVMAHLVGSASPSHPIQPGDLIIEANGQPIADVLKTDITPYINLGQEQSDLTIASLRFSLRSSLDMALPTAEEITLTFMRGTEVKTITLPWVVEDLLSFTEKQTPPEEPAPEEPVQPAAAFTQNPMAQAFYGFEKIQSVLQAIQSPVNAAFNRVQALAITGFSYTRYNPLMKMLFDGDLDQGDEVVTQLITRVLPVAGSIDDLYADAQIPAKIVTTDDGHVYAYIQITGFPGEDAIVDEWKKAITAINDKSIKAVIIDMIDNGGGSLVHGMRMANELRPKTIQLPSIQFRLNNNWVNSFRSMAATGPDIYRAGARKVVKEIREDMAAGQKLSRAHTVDVIDPFGLQDTSFGLQDDVKMALMVNEMCVSMCDIFASVVQDNKLGTIVGQRTMGGGGNVTGHGLSPISKFMVNLTESLVVRPNGEYIENNGVTPEILVDMAADREAGFKNAMNAAYMFVTGQTTLP